MKIGIPKEIKNNENRVAATPESVRAFRSSGHIVLIETAAGSGSGIPDGEYENAGAQIIDSEAELFDRSDMILKVREPLPPEYDLMKVGRILFAFILPARDPELTRVLMHLYLKSRGIVSNPGGFSIR